MRGLGVSNVEVAQPRSGVYRWMDAMRALAAFAVVLTHCRDFLMVDYSGAILWAPFYFITGIGHQAVIVFFVLSGFWIGRSTLRNLEQPDFWRQYLVARLSRLLIVLVPALMLGGALDVLGARIWQLPLYFAGTTHSMEPLSAAALSPLTFAGNLAFLQGILVPSLGSNGPLWSLACEFWFYLWFPALVSAWRGKPKVFLASLAMVVVAPQLAIYFAIWLMGVAVHLSEGRFGHLCAGNARRRNVVLLGSLALFLTTLIGSRMAPGPAGDIMLGLGFSVLLVVMLNASRLPGKAPQSLVFYGGKVSYSLYAVHFPILVFGIAASGLERSDVSVTAAMGVFAAALILGAIAYCFAMLTESRTDALRTAVLRTWSRR